MPVFQVGPPTPARGGQPGFIDPMEAIKDQEKIERFANLQNIVTSIAKKDAQDKQKEQARLEKFSTAALSEGYDQLTKTGDKETFKAFVNSRSWLNEGLDSSTAETLQKSFLNMADRGLSTFEMNQELVAETQFRKNQIAFIQQETLKLKEEGVEPDDPQFLREIKISLLTSPYEPPAQTLSDDRILGVAQAALLSDKAESSRVERSQNSQEIATRLYNSDLMQSLNGREKSTIDEFQSTVFTKDYELTPEALKILPPNATEADKTALKNLLHRKIQAAQQQNLSIFAKAKQSEAADLLVDTFGEVGKEQESLNYISASNPLFENRHKEFKEFADESIKRLQAMKTEDPELQQQIKRTVGNLKRMKKAAEDSRRAKLENFNSASFNVSTMGYARNFVLENIKNAVDALGPNPSGQDITDAAIKAIQKLGNPQVNSKKETFNFSTFTGEFDATIGFAPDDGQKLVQYTREAIVKEIQARDEAATTALLNNALTEGVDRTVQAFLQQNSGDPTGIASFAKGIFASVDMAWGSEDGPNKDQQETFAAQLSDKLGREFYNGLVTGKIPFMDKDGNYLYQSTLDKYNKEVQELFFGAPEIKITEAQKERIKRSRVDDEFFNKQVEAFRELPPTSAQARSMSEQARTYTLGLPEGKARQIDSLAKKLEKHAERLDTLEVEPTLAFESNASSVADQMVRDRKFPGFSPSELEENYQALKARLSLGIEKQRYKNYVLENIKKIDEVFQDKENPLSGIAGGFIKDYLTDPSTPAVLKNSLSRYNPVLGLSGGDPERGVIEGFWKALDAVPVEKTWAGSVKEYEQRTWSVSAEAERAQTDTFQRRTAGVLADAMGIPKGTFRSKKVTELARNLKTFNELAAKDVDLYLIRAAQQLSGSNPPERLGLEPLTGKFSFEKWVKTRNTYHAQHINEVKARLEKDAVFVFSDVQYIQEEGKAARIIRTFRGFDEDGNEFETFFNEQSFEPKVINQDGQASDITPDNSVSLASAVPNQIAPSTKPVAVSSKNTPVMGFPKYEDDKQFMEEEEWTAFAEGLAPYLQENGVHEDILKAFTTDAIMSSSLVENIWDHGLYDSIWNPRNITGLVSEERSLDTNTFYQKGGQFQFFGASGAGVNGAIRRDLVGGEADYKSEALHKSPFFADIYEGSAAIMAEQNFSLKSDPQAATEVGAVAGVAGGSAGFISGYKRAAKAGEKFGEKIGEKVAQTSSKIFKPLKVIPQPFLTGGGRRVGGAVGGMFTGGTAWFLAQVGGTGLGTAYGLNDAEIQQTVADYGNSATPMEIRVLMLSLGRIEDLRGQEEFVVGGQSYPVDSKDLDRWENKIIADLKMISPETLPLLDHYDF